MSNSYFQFKQFKIGQDRCAMKVSTDACIQGAWTPIEENVKRVLDVGTGTGLLALMLAQRKPTIHIDAIELDKSGILQAQENIADSPWSNNILVMHADARNYESANKYDLIISNPPFFQNSLLGPTASKNIARHTLQLNYTELLNVIEKNILPGGYASVMLPFTEQRNWERVLAEKQWGISMMLLVFSRDTRTPIRVISICRKYAKEYNTEKLVVREKNDDYSRYFIKLLEPFYLSL